MRQVGLHERYELTLKEREQLRESKRFEKLLKNADKKKLWALILGKKHETVKRDE